MAKRKSYQVRWADYVKHFEPHGAKPDNIPGMHDDDLVTIKPAAMYLPGQAEACDDLTQGDYEALRQYAIEPKLSLAPPQAAARVSVWPGHATPTYGMKIDEVMQPAQIDVAGLVKLIEKAGAFRLYLLGHGGISVEFATGLARALELKGIEVLEARIVQPIKETPHAS